jgi:HEAT repeat protein
LRTLLRDPDENVQTSAIYALGHHSIASADDLRELARHPSAHVRRAVAFSLDPNEPAAQPILIELMSDDDDDVRDWATFAIGSQTDTDSPQIRAALTQRLTDSEEEIRGEAMVGLACRGDLSIVDMVVAALEAGGGELVGDAAEKLIERHPNEARLTTALRIWQS